MSAWYPRRRRREAETAAATTAAISGAWAATATTAMMAHDCAMAIPQTALNIANERRGGGGVSRVEVSGTESRLLLALDIEEERLPLL